MVTFTEDGDTLIVCADWENDGICPWPPYTPNKNTMAVSKEEQQVRTWKTFAVKVHRGYSKYYSTMYY